MAINLTGGFKLGGINFEDNEEKNYNSAKDEYVNLIKGGNATPEQMVEAWENVQNALESTFDNKIEKEFERYQTMNQATNGLTPNEAKFFNQVAKSDGFESGVILPEETIERVFEDLTANHPLLSLIKFQQYKTIDVRIIKSQNNGVAVWGPVFGDIKGQLNAEFTEEKMTQNKLTTFIVLPKDASKFGPAWIASYIQTQLKEAFSAEFERTLLYGVGSIKHEPIGLVRDLSAAVSPTDGYAEKEAAGTLTFTDSRTIINEMTQIRKFLSVKENGRKIPTKGLVYLIVSPLTACDIEGKTMIQNANGEYINNIPFDFKIIESEYVPDDKLIACLPSRYDAYVAGGTEVNKYDQTLAFEDCDLYTAKTFLTGKPLDNKVSAVYDLELS